MTKNAAPYIPALSHDWLTPVIYVHIRWTMPEYAFKRRLIGQARKQLITARKIALIARLVLVLAFDEEYAS
jgi:hypothetical protein